MTYASLEDKPGKLRHVVPWKDLGWRPDDVSDWFRLLRVWCYLQRFVLNCSGEKSERIVGPVQVDELQEASVAMLRHMQQDGYQTELEQLRKKEVISPKSRIAGMCPILDTEGVMRGNSRLTQADKVSWDTKYPILLVRKHRITYLIVKRAHEDHDHVGTNHVLTILSAKYWMPGMREEIREMEAKCVVCKRRRAQPAQQQMAPLMPKRSEMTLRAFVNLSVDFAGPFLTKHGRGKSQTKRYLCVFVCMATRAIHLEMAYALDTSSFLNAFYRMVARRGLPLHVTSDNGSNFIGAERELNELANRMDKDKIVDSTANQGIKWTFNTPLAPHHNGVHEVMVRAAKRAMVHVLYKADLTDEELMSAIVGAEGLINSRPITYRGSHPGDQEPLTPNHFLFNQVGGDFAPEAVDTTDFHPRQRWRLVQEMVKHFWSRWFTEWIPSLSQRNKWAKEYRDLKIGELVLMLSPDTPRGKWPLGRVVDTFTGPDGHIRSAEVEVRGTIYKRPIVKLCPLEIN